MEIETMSNDRISFDAIGVVIDWIDACKQKNSARYWPSTRAMRPSNVAKAEASMVEPKWRGTVDRD
jgi:hypothetical protein